MRKLDAILLTTEKTKFSHSYVFLDVSDRNVYCLLLP